MNAWQYEPVRRTEAKDEADGALKSGEIQASATNGGEEPAAVERQGYAR